MSCIKINMRKLLFVTLTSVSSNTFIDDLVRLRQIKINYELQFSEPLAIRIGIVCL